MEPKRKGFHRLTVHLDLDMQIRQKLFVNQTLGTAVDSATKI